MPLTTDQQAALAAIEQSVADLINELPNAGIDSDQKGLRAHLRAVARDFTQLRGRINVG